MRIGDVSSGSKSKVSRANPRTTSLSSVVPKGIVEQLGLEAGDYLDWELQSSGSSKYVLVRKLKETR